MFQSISKVKQSYNTPANTWGERRYSFYLFLTSALDGGERAASHPRRALPPGKGPPVPIVQEAGWAPEPVWTERLEGKSFASAGIEPRSPGRPVHSQTLYWLWSINFICNLFNAFFSNSDYSVKLNSDKWMTNRNNLEGSGRDLFLRY
jgi:hypothetical protein